MGESLPKEQRWSVLALWGGIALLAGGFSVAVAYVRRFDGLYGQDAYAYLNYAQTLLTSLRTGTLPPPFFWPIGYPLLVALGMAVMGPTAFVGQSVSMLAGAVIVMLTALLGYESGRLAGLDTGEARRMGTVAGLVTLGCSERWLWSITVMSDTTALAGATLAAWALVRYVRSPRAGWLALGAVALAGAVMTRWIYGGLVVPLAGFLLAGTRNTRLRRHGAVAAVLATLVLIPQLIMSLRQPDPLVRHPWLVQWSPFNALRRSFHTPDGWATYAWPVALFYAKAFGSPRYLFPLLTPLLVWGTATVLRKSRQMAFLLIGWIAILYGFLAGIPYENFRFTLTWLPAQAVLTAWGWHDIWSRLTRRWKPILTGFVCAGLVGGLVYGVRVLDDFCDRKDADLAVIRWVAKEVPSTARVLAFEITLALQYYTTLEVHDLFLLKPAQLKTMLADDQPTYVILRVERVQRQWRGHTVERNFQWMRTRYRFIAIGNIHGYTLFLVSKTYPHPSL